MPYQLRTFGGWSLLGPDGEPIDAVRAHSKGGAALAYLATRPVGEAVDRADLLPLLWPDRTEEEGRNALRALLARLRRRLPEGALGGKGEDRVWVEESVLTSDARRFERAREEGRPRQALRLYQGPFLEHVHLTDAAPFNRWAEERRSVYRREAYGAALAVGEESREAGELGEAERAYRRALDLAPLKERAAAGLVRVLAARGQRADALQLYDSFRERLEEELDLSPSEGLAKLAERVRARPGDLPGPAPAGEEPPEAGRSPSGEERSPARWRKTGGLAAAVLVAGLAAAGLWLGLGPEGPAGGAGTDPAISDRRARPTVAVLPFENLGDAEEARPLLEGLHASLLTRLSNVSGLAVLSRSSVGDFGGGQLSPTTVADSLGAQWIVEGEAQLMGDEVQVNAQLVDGETETHAWAASYRRTLSADNLFAIQGEIARRIVRSLEAELTAAEAERIARRPTADLQAYRLFTRGRELLVQRTDSAMNRAEELFRRAVERDSSFAEAWAGLAQALVLYPAARDRDPDRVFPPGRRAARRALELDPNLPEAHMALAIVHHYRMRAPASLRRLRRAVQIEPNYAKAYHGLNLVHLVLGRPQEALSYARRAVALSPLSPENQVGLALASLAVGDHERGLRAARRVREIEPGYAGSFREGYALYRLGRLTEGDSVVGEGVRRQLLALAEATTGNETPARELLGRYRKRLDRPALAVGLLQAALGRREDALETFQAAFREQDTSGGGLTIVLRHLYPEVLGPLRQDPRWEELLRQINEGWGLDPDGSLPDSVDVSYGARTVG